MKRTLTILLAAVPVLFALVPSPWARTPLAPPQLPAANAPIAFVGARIYTSPYRKPIKNGVIIIRDGRFEEVGPHGKVHVPGGTGILDCSGMSIVAGFQNNDVHLDGPRWQDAAKMPSGELTDRLQNMFGRYGFTAIVDTGSSLETTVALEKRVQSGEVRGPKILATSAPLYPPDGVPDSLRKSLPEGASKRLLEPATPAEAIHDVDTELAKGADFIELVTGSKVSEGQVVTMPVAVAQAAVEEAHKYNRLVLAEPTNVAGFSVALHAHVDVLNGPVEDTEGWKSPYVRLMKAQGMSMIPTLTLFLGDANVKSIFREVRDFSKIHGQILFGTDVHNLNYYDPMLEYTSLKRTGMNFKQILDSLTRAPAQRVGDGGHRGEIQAGMDADFVVLAHDPAQSLRAFTEVNYTYRHGRPIYSVASR